MNNPPRNTATCGIILFLLAAISPAFPWSFGFNWNYPTIIDGVIQQSTATAISSNAYLDWHGGVITIVGAVGALFLIATGGVRPTPWWRTLGTFLLAVALMVFIIIYANRWHDFPVREYGGLMAIIAVAGLLLLCALDLRSALHAKTGASTPESGTAQ